MLIKVMFTRNLQATWKITRINTSCKIVKCFVFICSGDLIDFNPESLRTQKSVDISYPDNEDDIRMYLVRRGGVREE